MKLYNTLAKIQHEERKVSKSHLSMSTFKLPANNKVCIDKTRIQNIEDDNYVKLLENVRAN